MYKRLYGACVYEDDIVRSPVASSVYSFIEVSARHDMYAYVCCWRALHTYTRASLERGLSPSSEIYISRRNVYYKQDLRICTAVQSREGSLRKRRLELMSARLRRDDCPQNAQFDMTMRAFVTRMHRFFSLSLSLSSQKSAVVGRVHVLSRFGGNGIFFSRSAYNCLCSFSAI